VAASIPIPAAKPKILNIAAALAVLTRRRKGVIIRDPKEELPSDTPTETPRVKDKGKGILIESPKPMKKKDHIEMDAEYKASKRRKLHEQAKEDKDLKKQLEVVDDEDNDVFIEATPTGRKTMFEKSDGQDTVWRNQNSVFGQALVKS
nr:hypothetical protein [Tanacetum cinerariifolium]